MIAQPRRQIQTPGICKDICLKKLKFLLNQDYTMTEIANPPNHIRFKADLRKIDLPREVHLEVFANSNVVFTSSPELDPLFAQISANIELILRESLSIVSSRTTVRVARARRIKDYVDGLSVDDEIQRMVIVALCDIILDLIVTEKLFSFTTRREDLENESVGAKISQLERQHHVKLYKPKEIRDIRELRNKIAHGGTSPAREEAIYSREETSDIFNTL
jgi:hypothetical protein